MPSPLVSWPEHTLTNLGEVLIDELKVGDVVVTASGAHRPIRWIGRRDYDCRNYIKPVDVLPVRVAQDAIAPGVPNRDTFLSEGHALALPCVGTVLIPVHDLINGRTIRQVDAESVTFFHVELDSHDVILANNLPAETFLDCDNRRSFVGADATASHDAGGFCHPHHRGDTVAKAVREQIARRADLLDATGGQALAA